MFARFSKDKVKRFVELCKAIFPRYPAMIFTHQFVVAPGVISVLMEADSFNGSSFSYEFWHSDIVEIFDVFVRLDEDMIVSPDGILCGSVKVEFDQSKAREFLIEYPKVKFATVKMRDGISAISKIVWERDPAYFKYQIFAGSFLMEFSHECVDFIASDENAYVVYTEKCDYKGDKVTFSIPREITKVKFSVVDFLVDGRYVGFYDGLCYLYFWKSEVKEYYTFKDLFARESYRVVFIPRLLLKEALKAFSKNVVLCLQVSSERIILTEDVGKDKIVKEVPCNYYGEPFSLLMKKYYFEFPLQYSKKPVVGYLFPTKHAYRVPMVFIGENVKFLGMPSGQCD